MSTARKIEAKFFPYTLFLVWPLLALFYSILNYKSKYAKDIIWLFCIFFGFTFVIIHEGVDSAVYRSWLVDAYNGEVSFWSYTNYRTDYFNAIVTYAVAIFTKDYRVLFAVYGLIFGYFYSRNIWYFVEKTKENTSVVLNLLIIFFAFIIPFWNINGFRFYTATHMFLFGLIQMLLQNKSRYILLCLCVPLVHFGFVIPTALLLMIKFIGDHTRLYWVFLFLSLFIIQTDVDSLLSILPSSTAYDHKIAAYTHVQYLEFVNDAAENASWFLFNRSLWLSYIFLVFSFYLAFFKRKFLTNNGLNTFLSFAILLLALSTIISIIPVAKRFVTVSHLLFSGVLILFVAKYKHLDWMKYQLYIYAIPFLIYFIIEIRTCLEYVGLNTIFSNPFITWAFDNDTALIKFYPF